MTALTSHSSTVNTVEIISLLEEVKAGLSRSTKSADNNEVYSILAAAMQRDLTMDEAIVLVRSSPEQWEQIINIANEVKKAQFGNKVQYYAPVYLSSICSNTCTYCDFSAQTAKKIPRLRLTFDQFKREVEVLSSRGISIIELVSATDPKFPFELLVECIRYTKLLGKTVMMNNRPFSVEQYRLLKAAGLRWVWQWKESFDREAYAAYHIAGEKSNYDQHLAAYECMGTAGLDIGTGILMGLSSNWQYDVVSCIVHAGYLKKKYNVDITIGTPRYCSPVHAPLKGAPASDAMTDDKFRLAIALYRLCNRDCVINVSTRENLEMLKKLLVGGASMTNPFAITIPGGYAHDVKGGQFKHNSYSVKACDEAYREAGLDPNY